MKTILIPAEDHDAMPAVLETARLIARRFDAYMEGFAVHPAAAEFVAVDPLFCSMNPTASGPTQPAANEIIVEATPSLAAVMTLTFLHCAAVDLTAA